MYYPVSLEHACDIHACTRRKDARSIAYFRFNDHLVTSSLAKYVRSVTTISSSTRCRNFSRLCSGCSLVGLAFVPPIAFSLRAFPVRRRGVTRFGVRELLLRVGFTALATGVTAGVAPAAAGAVASLVVVSDVPGKCLISTVGGGGARLVAVLTAAGGSCCRGVGAAASVMLLLLFSSISVSSSDSQEGPATSSDEDRSSSSSPGFGPCLRSLPSMPATVMPLSSFEAGIISRSEWPSLLR